MNGISYLRILANVVVSIHNETDVMTAFHQFHFQYGQAFNAILLDFFKDIASDAAKTCVTLDSQFVFKALVYTFASDLCLQQEQRSELDDDDEEEEEMDAEDDEMQTKRNVWLNAANTVTKALFKAFKTNDPTLLTIQMLETYYCAYVDWSRLMLERNALQQRDLRKYNPENGEIIMPPQSHPDFDLYPLVPFQDSAWKLAESTNNNIVTLGYSRLVQNTITLQIFEAFLVWFTGDDDDDHEEPLWLVDCSKLIIVVQE